MEYFAHTCESGLLGRMRREGIKRLITHAALLMSPQLSLSAAAAASPLPAATAAVASSSSSAPATRHLSTFITMLKDDPAAQQKRALRSKVRRDLKSLAPSLRSQQDAAIQDIVLAAPWFKSCSRLCAYISCESLREVDTLKILSTLLHGPTHGGDCDGRSSKKLYVPRVEDKNSHMRMLHISSMDDLIANSMNILEPSPVHANGTEREDVMKAEHPVDLILLPGLAFDRTGRRLGRGGGYYDLFLNKYQEHASERRWKQPLLVALSYSVQIMEEDVIAVTPSDVPVDAIVSPDGVIPISEAALGIM